jgi:hypothetical protein
VTRPRGRADRGSVTAEIAIALPALVFVLLAALTAVAAIATEMRCLDAAREGARAAARGETRSAARAIAQRAAPAHATVTLASAGDEVSVEVSAGVGLLSAHTLRFTVRGRAVAATEPGVGEAGR